MVQDAEKWLMLETIDNAWKQHMLNIDHLKEGIGLRGWGQKNPLIEYKKEAFAMFTDMMRQIRWEIVHHIFHLNLDAFNKHEIEARREKELHDINMLSGQEEGSKGEPVKRDEEKIGRNDPCPCGSGKKYKKCCGVR
jgi:preprotein translocase subunit SecA